MEGLEKNKGVSPVIGVLLVVAIVVILAAVVGAIMFGFSDQLGEDSSNAAFELNEQDGTITPITTSKSSQYDIIVDGSKTKSISGNSVGNAIKIDNASSGSTVQIVNPETDQVVQEWKIDDEETSKNYEIIEDFEEDSISDFNTNGAKMEITQREGTEQLNITADNGETGFLGISENVNSSKYIFEFDASKLNDSSNQGGNWYLVLAESGGGFLQLGVKDGGIVRLSTGPSSGNTDKVVSKSIPYSTLTSASSATLQWAEGEDAYAKIAGTSLSFNATRYDFDTVVVSYGNPIETSSMYFDVIKKTK